MPARSVVVSKLIVKEAPLFPKTVDNIIGAGKGSLEPMMVTDVDVPELNSLLPGPVVINCTRMLPEIVLSAVR